MSRLCKLAFEAGVRFVSGRESGERGTKRPPTPLSDAPQPSGQCVCGGGGQLVQAFLCPGSYWGGVWQLAETL